MLKAYNEHTNLVSNADEMVVLHDHILDALALISVIESVSAGLQKRALVDIGSGAGFPALILALVFEDLSVLLIESVGKKTRFLSETAQALGLTDRVEVRTARAEDLAHQKQYRENFTLATARAVGKLDLVAELTIPFLSVGGYLLAQKSKQQMEGELEPGRQALSKLGGQIEAVQDLDATVLKRDLVVVKAKKIRATESKYPRATAQLKRPLY